ncbi:murein hydrolase activator EnvC family protein [Noviherbaspirillum humi]|nr:peptidoglycan DD-metalloendopeptidase family protein [Noviherbaspirillum humi]
MASAALLCLASGAALAARSSERTQQKQAAEAERAELKQKLESLKRSIMATEAAHGHAADELAHSERAISEANRRLHELDLEQKQTEGKLQELATEQDRLARAIAAQQKRLATSLRELYHAGNEDRIKLLLSGDNPNRINRDLQYMGYVSQAQAKLVNALRADMEANQQNQAEVQKARDVLEDIADEQREQKGLLEKEKTRHATLVAQLSGKLSAQRREADSIVRDEQRLGALVERLAKLIEEQRRAEALALEKKRQEEKQRQEALARARAEKQARLAGRNSANGKINGKPATKNPDAIDDDEPPTKIVARNELTPVAHVQDAGLERAFAALRGQLRLPVKGDLTARFGSRRGDGPNWKGLFIRAPEGAEIKAVAAGRVVFAEWLRGFGNLIIIDHGSQYMTIYGNNQAVLKRAGDAVKGGDVIASAGNSGGSEFSGLYFEMRHQGRAFDPLDWVTTR